MIITPKEIYSKLKDGSDVRVRLRCDMCGKETETAYHNYTVSQNKNNRNGETYCRGCATKISGKKKIGKPSWNKGKKFPERSGENSPTWNGGEYIDFHGYKMKYLGNENRDRKKHGWSSYKKEHTLIIEEYLGRILSKGEVVHHIDGNRINNNVDNLVLLKSNKEHNKVHHSLQKIGYELYKKGFLSFDKEKKEYTVAHVKFRELLGLLEADNQQPSLNRDVLEGSETRGRN